MRYFVIGDDGQKYGPADIPTLQGWIREGRLLPAQQLEDEASGARSIARAISGLEFPPDFTAPGNPNVGPQGSPYQQSSPYQQGYPRGGQPVGDNGQSDVTVAWILAAIGAITCGCGIIFQPIALIFAYRGLSKGHPGANAVRIFSFVFLGLAVFIWIAYIVLVVMAVRTGTPFPNQHGTQFRPA